MLGHTRKFRTTQTLQNNLTHQLEKIKYDITHTRTNQGSYICGGTGGWRRVVYLDMTNPSTACPSGWQLTGYSKSTCGRFRTTASRICDSAIFPVREEYSRICGRIRAYQWGHPDAFAHYHYNHITTIDGAYVDGVSLTHLETTYGHLQLEIQRALLTTYYPVHVIRVLI